MIRISFRRKSVCMGDDAMIGEYQIEMPDDALHQDLIYVALHGGHGNDWSIPYTGADSHWIIESNIGNLAHTYIPTMKTNGTRNTSILPRILA